MDQTSYIQQFSHYLQLFKVENKEVIIQSYQKELQTLPQYRTVKPAFFYACKEASSDLLRKSQDDRPRYFRELKAAVHGIFSVYTWPFHSAISIAIMSVSLFFFILLVLFHLSLLFFGVAAIVAGALDTYIGISALYSDVGTGLEFTGIGCFFLGIGGIVILLSSHWMKRIYHFVASTINQYTKKYSKGRIGL